MVGSKLMGANTLAGSDEINVVYVRCRINMGESLTRRWHHGGAECAALNAAIFGHLDGVGSVVQSKDQWSVPPILRL